MLLEQLTVVQNLVMPFTLQIEPPPDDHRARAEELAREVGLVPDSWSVPPDFTREGRKIVVTEVSSKRQLINVVGRTWEYWTMRLSKAGELPPSGQPAKKAGGKAKPAAGKRPKLKGRGKR